MKRKRKPMKDIDGQMFVVVVMGIRISLGSKKRIEQFKMKIVFDRLH